MSNAAWNSAYPRTAIAPRRINLSPNPAKPGRNTRLLRRHIHSSLHDRYPSLNCLAERDTQNTYVFLSLFSHSRPTRELLSPRHAPHLFEGASIDPRTTAAHHNNHPPLPAEQTAFKRIATWIPTWRMSRRSQCRCRLFLLQSQPLFPRLTAGSRV